jgi:hypothetical protein
MHDAPERLNPREALGKAPGKGQRWTKGRIGRRRKAMTTTRRRWPTAANAARLLAMTNLERAAQIAREMLRHPAVAGDPSLRALVYESMALAEQSRRELGEARTE